MKVHPTSVHLLVVVDDWTTPDGVYRQGHTSSYLASLQNPETQNIILTGTSCVLSYRPTDVHDLMSSPQDTCWPFSVYLTKQPADCV